MTTSELLLKTAFCCMACDGEIAPEEVQLVKKITEKSELFSSLDVEKELNMFIAQINEQGKAFLANYIQELAEAQLSQKEELQLVKLAIQTIEADENVEYSEVSFFKRIRAKLSISDEAILEALPDKEDYLLPDIMEVEEPSFSVTFDNISFNE